MTLRTSIILSAAIHLLLFGTGLAFARYTGNLLRRPAPILVTLVGEDGRAMLDRGQRSIHPRPLPAPEQRNSTSRDYQRPNEKQVHDLHDVPPGPQLAAVSTGAEAANNSVTRLSPSAGDSSGERTVGAESGTVSSEEWAIILSSIERAKNYPRLARERGIEGVVRVRFRLGPKGDVDRVEIVSSSGYDILDSASVKTVYRSGPMPYVSGWVEVPIAYVLK